MRQTYKLLLCSIGFLSTGSVLAQQNVGIGTKSPDNSAVLDIQSADKGLLIPRMSLDQRNLIDSPANGLMIYQTNDLQGFYYFNGNQWSPLSSNEANSIATGDVNGWALDGNAVAVGGVKALATASSFIGTPGGVPINFKIGSSLAGKIDPTATVNTFFGIRAGGLNTGSFNTAFGGNAMWFNTSGSYNVALGANALQNNIDGTDNMAIGSGSLRNTTSGAGNAAIGSSSLFANQSGSYNTAIGNQSSRSSTTSQYNTSIGAYSLYSNNGSDNTSIGYRAGYFANSSGNVFLGNKAGENSTGPNKLFIANSNTANPLIKGEFDNKILRINVGATSGSLNSVSTTGHLAIGNFDAASPMAVPAGYRLVVEQGILTEKIKVALKSAAVGGDWADYVFEPEYKANMMSLEDIEKFTIENKHLPNVPSSEEMVASGLDLAKTSKMFMEKIEELTLYMIELNKEVKSLKMENEILKTKLK